ncbi:MAG: hypothetical protein LQ351_004859 [Letrouitia transgressa]|nr:MAG: hypothetical protein LQ351_004859 [Letrouitia transgressa]
MAAVLSNSPNRPRLSPSVRALRHQMPYQNYSPPKIIVSQAAPEPENGSYERQPNWSGPHGYGCRHRLDDAPFSLWDEERHDFRYPSSQEEDWIGNRYGPATISFQWPIIILATANIPTELPLTLACVAVKFTPPSEETIGFTGQVLPIVEDILPLSTPTNYAGMRGPPDPLPFAFTRWLQPSDKQLETLAVELVRICNPSRVHILCPNIIIELHTDDQRVYEPGSLPRTIGGFAVFYHHGTEPFGDLSVRSQQRLLAPTASNQDQSDYLGARQELCPGVCVSLGTVSDIGQYATLSMSTTAGIMLRNNRGDQRLTVSNHGFLHSNEVYHPTPQGKHIGEINERWHALDIALVTLNPSVRFTNANYFESKVPRRLLYRGQVPLGVFFGLDGMSSGMLWFQSQGVTMMLPKRPSNMTEIGFHKMILYQQFGNGGVTMREGICGAAIVEDDTDSGGVAGFFWEASPNHAFSPCLDELIDRGWMVV